MCYLVDSSSETSAKMSCLSSILLSERVSEQVRVFVSQPLPRAHLLPW